MRRIDFCIRCHGRLCGAAPAAINTCVWPRQDARQYACPGAPGIPEDAGTVAELQSE